MRLIDADAYASEMKKRQDACMEAMENASYEGEQFSPKQHWEGVLAAFAEAKLTLDDMPTIGGWISVKDRLPDRDGEYMVYGQSEAMWELLPDSDPIWVCNYYKEHGFYSIELLREYDCITHWMPLPEPPEEDGNA